MTKNLVILGAGESGAGAAVLGKTQGWEVFVSDKGTIAPKYKTELNKWGVIWEEETHTESSIFAANLIVKSPGIPDTAPIVKKAKELGIEVISEIEFGYRYCKATIIGITGTNGKTTTTLLTYHLLKSAGLNVGLGGNIGDSFARSVALKNYDIYVLEISSFQLDGIKDFRCHIAILTNITPDHLDRYDYKLENYQLSKMRIAMNQTEEDFFIHSADDELTLSAIPMMPPKSKRLGFSLFQTEQPSHADYQLAAWALGQIIHINTKTTLELDMKTFTVRGQHNAYNSMAAAVAANLLEVRKDSIRESFTNFQNVEHRLEFVARITGVEYINDSKATNVNSAWYALESMEKPVIWICGGVDKGNDYNSLKALVKDKVKMIICLGVDNRKIHQAFQNDVDLIINTQSAKEAVHVASKMAMTDDVVLLSPACASFDLFDNYEDRGRQFKEAVRNL
ncbi:MAG: UDP-N-acetylmuramoylalanine-D-glutamate ligase [Bacteroidota bacterium]|jgi:UDP-N-acetylmuramoylalanine--D-glutamate ligase